MCVVNIQGFSLSISPLTPLTDLLDKGSSAARAWGARGKVVAAGGESVGGQHTEREGQEGGGGLRVAYLPRDREREPEKAREEEREGGVGGWVRGGGEGGIEAVRAQEKDSRLLMVERQRVRLEQRDKVCDALLVLLYMCKCPPPQVEQRDKVYGEEEDTYTHV